MSTVKMQVVWHLKDAYWIEEQPEMDTISVLLQAGGEEYAVACSGPKGMTSNQFISALRAATAGLIRATGGDMSVVGVGTLEDATFDTGAQRPS
jgi:hypothetical protein